MESSERKITKIAREAGKLVRQRTKETDIGSSEMDLIHIVRHHPGILQSRVVEQLHEDKGAIAHRVLALEKKGYIERRIDPNDRRKHLLYPLAKAEELKSSKKEIESDFYTYLFSFLEPEEKEQFEKTLDKLYLESKKESRAGFPHTGGEDYE